MHGVDKLGLFLLTTVYRHDVQLVLCQSQVCWPASGLESDEELVGYLAFEHAAVVEKSLVRKVYQ